MALCLLHMVSVYIIRAFFNTSLCTVKLSGCNSTLSQNLWCCDIWQISGKYFFKKFRALFYSVFINLFHRTKYSSFNWQWPRYIKSTPDIPFLSTVKEHISNIFERNNERTYQFFGHPVTCTTNGLGETVCNPVPPY